LGAVEDPVIVDRRTDSSNREWCVDKVKGREGGNWDTNCDVETSPELICLDAKVMPDGSGPDVSGPTGGTLVTVGVGSGDYYFQSEGDGGAGGFSAEPGEGAHGEI
jgi:hypothetical protein